MKTYLDCLPCLLNQALKAARATTDDEELQRTVLNSIAAIIPQIPLDLKPPEIAQRCYRLIYQITGNDDPFYQARVEANCEVLAVYPQLKQLLEQSQDRLLTACKLAIVGNSLDLGPTFHHGGIEHIIETALTCPLVVNEYEQFRSSIDNARHVLYLGDNAGEIVFDRLLIEEIHRGRELDVDFVVRGRPIVNDATIDDALAVGMDKIARIVSNGSEDAPGTILSQCSEQMLKLYHSADVIIAKGGGNYESLEDEPGNIFFLLRAKCPTLAETLGINIGDCALKQQFVAVDRKHA